MSNRTPVTEIRRAEDDLRSELDEIVRRGAQRMLQAALEAEVEDYVRRHREQVDENNRRLVVRNGRKAERTVLTGAGGLEVSQPRVNDRRDGQHFTSSILPPYMRRSPSLDALIPALYLKGVSTGDFAEALEAILGPDAAGLSANTVTRLKEDWATEYEEWNRRDLKGKRYVYWWADGIHFNVRLEEERTCILVLMGTLENGTKELIAVVDGYRESEISWRDLMLDLKGRGLEEGPKLAVGDGALGFWAALREEFGDAREQRCWVHKTANILDSRAAARQAEPSETATAGSGNMPKGVQPRAKQRIHDMYMAETKEQALVAYEQFMVFYEAKYPKVCRCLAKSSSPSTTSPPNTGVTSAPPTPSNQPSPPFDTEHGGPRVAGHGSPPSP
jgi:transposase-like protein